MTILAYALVAGVMMASLLAGRSIARRLFNPPPELATVAFGLAIFVVAMGALLAGWIVLDQARIDRNAEAERSRKAEFLRQLCDERRANGETPGGGC